ncbi:MAG TPA: hypothetical protein V6C71_13875 [Coleofasciculaceae cyanobacterium]|jgi:hypothetical protein
MKKQLSSVLLAVSIFTLNAIPAQANNKETLSSTKNSESNINSGEWCFELPWMGLFCYEL